MHGGVPATARQRPQTPHPLRQLCPFPSRGSVTFRLVSGRGHPGPEHQHLSPRARRDGEVRLRCCLSWPSTGLLARSPRDHSRGGLISSLLDSELVAWLMHHGNGVFMSELPFGGGERKMAIIDRLPDESMGLGVFGCEVRLVAQEGLAAAAGLREGDLILKINGRVRRRGRAWRAPWGPDLICVFETCSASGGHTLAHPLPGDPRTSPLASRVTSSSSS